mgnify:FL=1
MKEITIKIEGKEWEEAMDKAFQKANKKAKIDGFRPGKAPKDIFIKKYGKESLMMDAADLSINDAYLKMLEENKDLEIVAQPELKLKSLDENGVEFVFTLTLKPEVKLGKYKGLKVTKDSTEVTEEEIDETIMNMRNRYAENRVKDGEIVDGDVAVIDFEGFKDDVPFEGGKAEGYSLKIGSHTFIPGFEEALVGMKAGESKDIHLTFPEDYHSEELKGQPVVFKVTVNEVKETIIPELSKEFYEDLGMEGINDEESLRNQVKENIAARKEMEAENKYTDDLLKAAIENMTVEVPEVMVTEEIDRMLRQYEDNLKMQGLTLEQFYQFTNSDEAALKDQMKEEALNRVKARLLLEEVAKVEKLEISDEEADQEAEKLAERYGMKKDEFLAAFGGLDMVKYDSKMRKAIEVLKLEK